MLQLVGLIVLAPAAFLAFQNCADKAFNSGGDTPITGHCSEATCITNPDNPYKLLDHIVKGEFNTPKDWTAPHDGDRTDKRISLAADSDLLTLELTGQGRLEILDGPTHQLRFIPQFGFRGQIVQILYALDAGGNNVSSAEVTIQVGNSLNFFQPALAVRGSGCVLCHANVQSNVITDLGFGNTYYFGQNIPAKPSFTWNGKTYEMTNNLAWNHGSIYGDHDAFFTTNQGPQIGNAGSLNHGEDRKVFVPAAPIPHQSVRDLTNETTLAGYFSQRFSQSTFAGTRAPDKVVEKSLIYIGAPTAARLYSAFNWSSGQGNLVYKKETGGRDFSGITSAGTYFRNTGPIVCEGDLLVNGTLLLEEPVLRTRTGCRIYATGSVFMYGAITYENEAGNELRNLQITSAKAILMGLGQIIKDGTHCEENSPPNIRWYWDQIQPANFDQATNGLDANAKAVYEKSLKDTAFNRLFFFWPMDTFFTRGASVNPRNAGLEIYNELVNKIGLPFDAACRPGGRGVSFERLLLNAPRVESRYNGDFIGSIIAEISVMALGQFKFQFDPVFSNVPILPRLNDSDYLRVE